MDVTRGKFYVFSEEFAKGWGDSYVIGFYPTAGGPRHLGLVYGLFQENAASLVILLELVT